MRRQRLGAPGPTRDAKRRRRGRTRGAQQQHAAVQQADATAPAGVTDAEVFVRTLLGDLACVNYAIPVDSGISVLGLVYHAPRAAEGARQRIYNEWHGTAMPRELGTEHSIRSMGYTYTEAYMEPPLWSGEATYAPAAREMWRYMRLLGRMSPRTQLLRDRHGSTQFVVPRGENLLVYSVSAMREWCQAVEAVLETLPRDLIHVILEWVSPATVARTRRGPRHWGALTLHTPGEATARALLEPHCPALADLARKLRADEDRMRDEAQRSIGPFDWA
jgi:hypothetical protein